MKKSKTTLNQEVVTKEKSKKTKQKTAVHSAHKAKDFRGTTKMLFKNLGRYKALLIVAVIFAILATVLNIVGPRILNELMTLIFGQNYQLSEITRFGLLIVGIYILAAILNYFQGYCMSKVSVQLSKKLRSDIIKKINRLPLNYFDRHSYGDVLSRVTNDVDTVGNTLQRTLSSLITSTVTIIGIPIIMFTLNWQLTLVALLQIPIALITIFVVVKNNQKYFVKQQKYLADVDGYVEENFSAHNVVKAFNAEAKSQNEFDKINNELRVSSKKAQFFSGIVHPLVVFSSNFVYVLICLVGGYIALQSNDGTFLATIITFMTYTKLFNQPIQQIASVSSTLQSTIAAAERVFEFINEKDEPDESEKRLTIDKIKGKVEFRDVSFGYTPDKEIIHNFNFTALPGQKIAIVGQTGAGKTTIVNLLMRFYEVNSGQILIDGIPTDQMNRTYVRSLFGMVLQETWLFEGTIRENIAFGNPNATDEEIVKACQMANVDHFIRTEPKGYDMVLSEDTSISAGQKQLMTIARAMVQNAPMLILDEATSSVDTRTEILIQTAMDRLTKGRTSFVIAHRLSTIKNADQIIVMKDGNIVEIGKHDELLKKNGAYKELYTSQFETGESF